MRQNKVRLTPELASKEAGKHFNAGNLDEAAKICELILQAEPDHEPSLNLRGVICLKKEEIVGAQTYFEKLVELSPEKSGYWMNLGQTYFRQDNFTKAATSFRNGFEGDEPYVGLRPLFVISLIRTSQFIEAFKRCSQWLVEETEQLMLLEVFAKICVQTGRFWQAQQAFKRLIDVNPEAETSYKMGLVELFIAANLPIRAKSTLEEILQNDPENQRALWSYGELFQQAGVPEKAIEPLLKACDQKPVPEGLYLCLANVYTDLNENDEAKKIIKKVLYNNPDLPQAYLLLSHLQSRGLSAKQISTINKIAQGFEPQDQRNIPIEFALARTADAKKEYHASFEHYKKGNKLFSKMLENQGRSYHRPSAEKRNEILCDVFSKDFFAEVEGLGDPSKKPIFIAGLPRSGTTLSEQILASHSRIEGVGELLDLPHLAVVIREITKSKEEFPLCMKELPRERIRDLAGIYLKRISDWAPKADHVVNKLPGNFFYLGLVRTLFPNARIIHCVRDPRDTLLSCYFANFGPGHSYSFDLDDLAHQYKIYANLMDHWEEVLPGSIYHSLYARLVNTPEEAIKSMLAYCDLDWEENCMMFYKSGKTVRTASRMQVRKPIYTSSLDRWKRYEGLIDPIKGLELPEKYLVAP